MALATVDGVDPVSKGITEEDAPDEGLIRTETQGHIRQWKLLSDTADMRGSLSGTDVEEIVTSIVDVFEAKLVGHVISLNDEIFLADHGHEWGRKGVKGRIHQGAA